MCVHVNDIERRERRRLLLEPQHMEAFGTAVPQATGGPVSASHQIFKHMPWIYLVGGDWITWLDCFSRLIGNGIIFPIDELIFFRGVGIPPTRNHDFPMQQLYFFNPHFEIRFSDISYPYHIWSPEVRPDSVVNIGWTNSPTVKPKPLLVDVPDVNKCLLIGLCPKYPLRRRS